MKTRDEVLKAIELGRESSCLDGRDYARLTDFFPVEDWLKIGIKAKESAENHFPIEWTEENIKHQLSEDVAFGFEKALDKRGLSAGAMHEVVKMWMWVLDDELQYSNLYAQYGLPFLKAVALKYGFPNEIGTDRGDEHKYSSSGS